MPIDDAASVLGGTDAVVAVLVGYVAIGGIRAIKVVNALRRCRVAFLVAVPQVGPRVVVIRIVTSLVAVDSRNSAVRPRQHCTAHHGGSRRLCNEFHSMHLLLRAAHGLARGITAR